jgi:hypothetical protein
MQMKKIVNKHSLATRWFHWFSFPVLMVMNWSWLLIYWANDVYKLGWRNTTIIRFFPQPFYDVFHLDRKLSESMAFHFVFMWWFFMNGFLYAFLRLFRASAGNCFPIVIHLKSLVRPAT